MTILESWKCFGITSNEFARRYKLENNLENVCYAGRLDPLAQGNMLILTNEDTKKVKHYLKHDKVYTFDLILGISTESHDCLSKINNICNTEFNDTIILKLSEFIKTYNIQTYPFVSNYIIKHTTNEGIYIKKPLWWFYANGYKESDIILPSKNVNIYNYKINSIDQVKLNKLVDKFINRISLIDNQQTQDELKTKDIISQWEQYSNSLQNCIVIKMEMGVSSGFYIRQFCNDFGKYINNEAIAFDITRKSFEFF